jgi:protein tyrosine phosphatase (PTP) superfamily phosphohydrolase (DUF442 family)
MEAWLHTTVELPEHVRLTQPETGAVAERRRPRRGWFRSVPLVPRVLLVAVLVLGLGNAGILAASALAQSSAAPAPSVDGVGKLRYIDEHVWRSAAPTAEGYRNLAAMGVTTVVDLRAESDLESHEVLFDEIGVQLVRLPTRDGQVPAGSTIAEFLEVVRDSRGTVLVHCGAGVGRTGVMVAAYLLESGAPNLDVLRHNLSVGPPSIEQLAFAASGEQPGVVVSAASRFFDAPRRMWHNLG